MANTFFDFFGLISCSDFLNETQISNGKLSMSDDLRKPRKEMAIKNVKKLKYRVIRNECLGFNN